MSIIEQLLEQEKETILKHFTNEDALKLGLKIIEFAKEDAKRIVISIKRNGQHLFYSAGEYTDIDNEFWTKRKRNVVERHGHSSYFVRLSFNENEEEYYRVNGVNPNDFAIHGGGFPISIEGTGVIGNIVVSGLEPEDDHMLCVNSLKALKSEQ